MQISFRPEEGSLSTATEIVSVLPHAFLVMINPHDAIPIPLVLWVQPCWIITLVLQCIIAPNSL